MGRDEAIFNVRNVHLEGEVGFVLPEGLTV